MKHRTGLDRHKRCFFLNGWRITLPPKIPCVSSMPSLGRWICRRWDLPGPVVPTPGGRPISGGAAQAYLYGYLHRVRSSRLLEAECPAQRGSDLAHRQTDARLQDHCRLPQR